MVGGARSDSPEGGSEIAKLQGGAGADLSNGGSESDSRFGGTGAEVFQCVALKDSGKSSPASITDFGTGGVFSAWPGCG